MVGIASAAALPPPPQSGSFVTFKLSVVLCDTIEQVTAIFEAGKDNAAGTAAKLDELHATRNAKNEPTCQLGHVQPVFVVKSVELGWLYEIPGEQKYRAWAVQVSNPRFEGWLLYAIPGEPGPVAQTSSERAL